jgi:hypothetical protein
MKETKLYCDVCKEEIGSRDNYSLNLLYGIPVETYQFMSTAPCPKPHIDWDLCGKCAHKAHKLLYEELGSE